MQECLHDSCVRPRQSGCNCGDYCQLKQEAGKQGQKYFMEENDAQVGLGMGHEEENAPGLQLVAPWHGWKLGATPWSPSYSSRSLCRDGCVPAAMNKGLQHTFPLCISHRASLGPCLQEETEPEGFCPFQFQLWAAPTSTGDGFHPKAVVGADRSWSAQLSYRLKKHLAVLARALRVARSCDLTDSLSTSKSILTATCSACKHDCRPRERSKARQEK